MCDIDFPRPTNFPYEEVFYSDGISAMMIGQYKESSHRDVGLRWTVAESPTGLGYPNVFGRSMWMVLPTKLALYLLEGIQNDMDRQAQHIRSIRLFEEALSEIRVLVEGE